MFPIKRVKKLALSQQLPHHTCKTVNNTAKLTLNNGSLILCCGRDFLMLFHCGQEGCLEVIGAKFILWVLVCFELVYAVCCCDVFWK